MQQLEVKFGDKTLFMNIDDVKAQRKFREERERAFIESCRKIFLV